MNVEVCLAPPAYRPASKGQDRIVVVSDIFRATSSICAALHHGARTIRPVASLEEARRFKIGGSVVAAEEDGLKPGFADFGNDPLEFLPERVKGIDLVMATTNGTKAIRMAAGDSIVAAGSFLNMSVLASWLSVKAGDVLLFCAGWKDRESLEDTLHAGAMAQLLSGLYGFQPVGDAAAIAMGQWRFAEKRLVEIVRQGEHYQRLDKLGLTGSVNYILSPDLCPVIPVYQSGLIRDVTEGR